MDAVSIPNNVDGALSSFGHMWFEVGWVDWLEHPGKWAGKLGQELAEGLEQEQE